MIQTSTEQGNLADGNIFYNVGANKIPYNMKVDTGFEQTKQNIINFAKLEEKQEELEVELGTTYAKAKLKDSSKNQNVKVILTRDIEVLEGEYVGNYIEGTVKDSELLFNSDGTPKLDANGNQEKGNPIEGVLVELYEEDRVTEAKDKDGNVITARTDSDGYYKLSGVPGAALDTVTFEAIPKKYVVKFTYGDAEQFSLAQNTKYNGQDYESTEATFEETTEEIITYLETEEVVEEEVVEETEEPIEQKVNVYLVVDNSGSMAGIPLEKVKEGAKIFVDNIYNEYRR